MSIDASGESSEVAPKSVEQLIDETMAERAAWRREHWQQVDVTAHPEWDARWAPKPVEYSGQELARGAEVEARDVADGLDGSDEVYTDEHGNPLPQYAGLLPEGMNDFEPESGDAGSEAPDLPPPTDEPGETAAEGVETGESAGIGESRAITTTEAGTDPTYASPADVREGILSGSLSAPEARRKFRELAPPEPAGPADPTTELVRTEGDQRFERGTPQQETDRFGERVAKEENSDTSRAVRDERKYEARVEAAGGLANRLAENADRVEVILTDDPSGDSMTCWVGQPQPEIGRSQQYQDHSAGDLASLGVVGYVVAEKAYRKAGEVYLGWLWGTDGEDDDGQGVRWSGSDFASTARR